MQINFVYDSSVNSAPAAFKTALQTAANILDSTIANPITIAIQVGWGENAGTPINSTTALATGGPGSSVGVTYSQLVNALTATANSNNSSYIVASLPKTDPTGSSATWWGICPAQALALNINNPYAGAAAGTVGFAADSGANWCFDTTQGIGPHQQDFVAAAIHEITHAMGRGDFNFSSPGWYDSLNLYTYASQGNLQLTNNGTANYFSINGGSTNLSNFDTTSSGDPSDWARTGVNDSFNAYQISGKVSPFSVTDRLVLQALGYNVPSAQTALAVSIAAGAASVNEGNNATFTITLNAAQSTATSVYYTLAGTGGTVLGTDTGVASVAGSGISFSNSSGNVITFAPGATTATITVPITSDTPDNLTGKGISVTLTSPSAGTALGTAVANTLTPDTAFTASTVGALTQAQVYLGIADVFTIGSIGTTVYGNTGNDTVTVASGVTGASLDQNVQHIILPGASSSYTYLQTGNLINVYDTTSTTLLVKSPVHIGGTVFSFSNGTASALLTTGVITLGGATVSSSTPTALAPATTANSAPSTSLTQAQVYLGVADVFTVSSSGTTVYGNTGNDTVTIASGVTGVSLDQNVQQINLSGSSSSYTYLQTGNLINVYDATGTTLLAKAPVHIGGTVFSFSDGIASALLTTGVLTLGGTTVSSSAAMTLTFSGNSAVAVTAAGTESGAGGHTTFNVAVGNYTNTITNFVVGDNVVFPATGAAPTVVNPSFTDGTVTLQWANAGQTVQIILTGLTNAQDAAAGFTTGSNTFHV
jgi:hypothetical protein